MIAFGHVEGHSVREVVKFEGVWKRLVIQVHQQWQESQSAGNSPLNCVREGICANTVQVRVTVSSGTLMIVFAECCQITLFPRHPVYALYAYDSGVSGMCVGFWPHPSKIHSAVHDLK